MASKSAEDTNIAVVALAVALCALIISLGQLFGQYFAAAEGYRKCQPSVMGPWAKRTRLRWRWSQFRFETMFTAPRIFLTPFEITQDQRRLAAKWTDNDNMEHISGTPDSRYRTMSVSSEEHERNSELACWLPFLGSLHRNEWNLQDADCYLPQSPSDQKLVQHRLVGPALRFQELSWDSMPSDIMQPLAVTTLSDIAIMARRLGMLWKVFDPIEGSMRAEGNGHAIISTHTGHRGLTLRYLNIGGEFKNSGALSYGKKASHTAQLMIPTREADMMGFGILPGCHRLGIPVLKMGTIDEVCSTMEVLDESCRVSRDLRDMNNFQKGLKWEHLCTFGFSDIIALAAPMIRGRRSIVTHVPRPAEYCSSLLSQQEGFVVFHVRLQDYLAKQNDPNSFDQANWVLQQYEGLKQRFDEWENEHLNRINECNLELLAQLHDCWDLTTDYFASLQESEQLNYRDLMTSHVGHTLKYWGDAWKNVKAGTARDKLGMRAVEAEGMHLYFDYLPLVVKDMRAKGFEGCEGLAHEAWFTLMFRAFCWWRCHTLSLCEDETDKGIIVPSQYWGSKLPVYIG